MFRISAGHRSAARRRDLSVRAVSVGELRTIDAAAPTPRVRCGWSAAVWPGRCARGIPPRGSGPVQPAQIHQSGPGQLAGETGLRAGRRARPGQALRPAEPGQRDERHCTQQGVEVDRAAVVLDREPPAAGANVASAPSRSPSTDRISDLDASTNRIPAARSMRRSASVRLGAGGAVESAQVDLDVAGIDTGTGIAICASRVSWTPTTTRRSW